MNFEELLDRLRRRDEEAANEFVRRYRETARQGRRIHGRNASLQGRVDSEDVAQSVILKALRWIQEGGEVRSERHLENLLRQMARQKVADHGRKVETHPAVHLDHSAAQQLAEAPAVQSPHGEALERLMRQLSDRQRKILQARLDGSSVKEIAEEQDLKVAAVYEQWYRIQEAAQEQQGRSG
jgi:RNA polymerase sigma factor (sigma-70 family)